MKGKTIALLRLDGPESADAAAFLQAQSKLLGFTLLDLPVGLKEVLTQSAQWQEIDRARPDHVVISGLATMTEIALAEARKANFPISRLIGMAWSTSDAGLALLGDAAKGYRAVSWNLPGADAPVLRDIAEARDRRRQGRPCGGRTIRAVLSARRGRRRDPGRGDQAGAFAFRPARHRPHAIALGAGAPESRRRDDSPRSASPA